jgi:hypothetical protein
MRAFRGQTLGAGMKFATIHNPLKVGTIGDLLYLLDKVWGLFIFYA